MAASPAKLERWMPATSSATAAVFASAFEIVVAAW